MTTTAKDKYEEFREQQSTDPSGKVMAPWSQLTPTEKSFWEKEWGKYTGDLDAQGDPSMKQKS